MLAYNMHVILREEINALTDASMQGILQGHQPQVACPLGHGPEHGVEILAGGGTDAVSEAFQRRHVRKGALRPQKRRAQRPLQGAGRGKYLAPYPGDVLVRQPFPPALAVDPEQSFHHFLLPLGPEHGAALVLLGRSHHTADFRPAVQQRQQFAVHLVDGGPQFRQIHSQFSLMSSSMRMPK